MKDRGFFKYEMDQESITQPQAWVIVLPTNMRKSMGSTKDGNVEVSFVTPDGQRKRTARWR
jgi:hypothetical protein